MKITKNVKIWTIITLIVIVVGMALYGFLGFNEGINYKEAKEVEVKVLDIEKSKETVKETCEAFFDESDVSYKSFSVSEDADGNKILRFRFAEGKSEALNDEAMNTLEGKLKTALSSLNLEAEVKLNQGRRVFVKNVGTICLALGLSVVAIFVYLFFVQKLVSAVSVICGSVISGLLFISVMGIVRIPASPFIELGLVLTVMVSTLLSSGLVARFKEEMKNVANAKLTSSEIAEKAIGNSIVRFSFAIGSLLVASLLLLILGSALMRILGLQIIVSIVSAVFSSIVWTPVIWSLLKKNSKSHSPKTKTEE